MNNIRETIYIDPKRQERIDKTRPLVFCFHYAGGTAGAFKPWETSTKVNFIPIELPGHGRRIREELTTSLSAICRDVAFEISQLMNTEDFFGSSFSLYGHSMGAIMAFCTAKLLIDKYRLIPTCVQVSGRHAPMDEDPSSFRTDQGMDALIDELRLIGHTPAEFIAVKEFRDFCIPMIFSDYVLAEDYQYDGTVLDLPIFAYCGREDFGADENVMKRWNQVTKNRFRIKSFSGDHFFIFEEGAFFSDLIAKDLLELCESTESYSPILRREREAPVSVYYERGEI